MLIIFTSLNCSHFASVTTLGISSKTLPMPLKFRWSSLSTLRAGIKLNIPTISSSNARRSGKPWKDYKFRADGRFTGHTTVLKTDLKKTKLFL